MKRRRTRIREGSRRRRKVKNGGCGAVGDCCCGVRGGRTSDKGCVFCCVDSHCLYRVI